jgi:pimeloyl-ACP methyl ester carboxylesterase
LHHLGWRIALRLGRSELFLLPDARHDVQLDEPRQVARLILTIPKR